MTRNDHDHNTPDAQHDARLAEHYFNESKTGAVNLNADDAARLDRWTDALGVLDEVDQSAIVATVPWPGETSRATQPAGRSHWTASPWFRCGLAAGILLLITLFFIGTEIRADDGELVVRLGPVGRSSGSIMSGAPAAQWITADELDRAVQIEADERLSALAVELAEVLTTMEQRRRADDAALIEVIMQLREADLQRVEKVMQGLAIESAQQTAMTRASITQLIESGLLRWPPDSARLEDLY